MANRCEDENIDLSFTKQWHAELHPSERGRRPFDVDVLFRITLLQQFFGLSDPQAEQDIHDRSSYQMFLGITADTDIPDETTICRFRKMLVMKGWDNAFFKEVERQLREHGIIVTSGKSVDATISEVPKGRKREDGTSSTAKDHDSIHEDKVLDGNETAVFEDSAYINKEKRTSSLIVAEEAELQTQFRALPCGASVRRTEMSDALCAPVPRHPQSVLAVHDGRRSLQS